MYTQCPDCNLSFRVSADVLKQAAGKVRCGGCSNTFNALLHLSETKPGEQPDLVASGAPPELEADPIADPDATPPPTAVSPEQNRELMESLARLTESDVRLEDTGVEWRILSDEPGEGVDELLDADPTPLDEDLSADLTDTNVDASDIFEIASREMRFDDDTGLPDNFDHDTPSVSTTPAPAPAPEPTLDHGDTHIDIAFGDPEEWGALLGELTAEAEPSKEEVPQVEAEQDELAEAVETEAADETVEAPLLDDDGSPGDDLENELAEMDALLADAEPGAAEAIEIELEETQRDLKDSTIEEDLMAAAFESERLRLVTDDDPPAPEELLLTTDQDEAQGARLGDDLEIALDLDDSIALDLDALDNDEDGIAMAFMAANEDTEQAASEDGSAEADELAELEELDDLEELDEPMEVIADEPTIHEVPEQSEEEQTINRMIDEELLAAAYEDEDGFTSTIIVDDDLAKAALAEEPEAEAEEKAEAASGDEAEPEPTVEAEQEATEENAEFAAFDIPEGLEDGDGVETIVMEGESFGDGDSNPGADAAAESEAADMDPEIAALRKSLKEQADAEAAADKGWLDERRMPAAVAVLAVLLIVQAVHFSRTALATVPGIGGTIEPIYAALGMPITPNWNVTGWQIEVSKASTDPTRFTGGVAPAEAGDGERLTIVSRIRNRSAEALPHPLLSVSLTDIFEEPIGNQVLPPADYLPGDIDPQAVVAPGKAFNAIISIETPDPDTDGFRLTVCYRQADSRLRCSIGAFK